MMFLNIAMGFEIISEYTWLLWAMLIKQLRQSIAGKIPITVIHLQFGDELADLLKASRHLVFQGLKGTDQPE